MVKISRSAFFTMLVASGAILLSEGCGAGTTPNSSFVGAYNSAYSISTLNENGSFDFTIGLKGNITGIIDDGAGKVRQVTGTLKNNGSFSGTTFDRVDNIQGTISGVMAGLGPGGQGVTVALTGGTFQLVENGVTSSGQFTVGGTVIAPGSSGFEGFFNGNYSIPNLSQNGTVSFSVDSSGKITGSLTKGTDTGLLTGSIVNSGVFTMTATFSDGTTLPLTGTLVKTTDGSTVGNFTATISGKTYAGSFSKTTVTTGDSPFSGSYAGTYGVPEQGENGTISFTVGPSGGFTGFFSQTNNQPVGTFLGAFNNDGSFAGSITYDPSTGIKSRTITGQAGTPNVGGSFAGNFVETINGVLTPGNFNIDGGPEIVSFYQASYSNESGLLNPAINFGSAPAAILPGQFSVNPSSGNLYVNEADFNVDKEGNIIGTIATLTLAGRITNDARVVGTITGLDGVGYAFRGVINKLTFKIGTGTNQQTLPGIQGDLIFTVKGTEYSGTVQSLGGDGITGGV